MGAFGALSFHDSKNLSCGEGVALLGSVGRRACQRTTLYADAPAEQVIASFDALALGQPVNTLSAFASTGLSRKCSGSSEKERPLDANGQP